MPRILLSAYCCIPNAGSEYEIGWNWAKSIAAKCHQVTVITRERDKDRIQAACDVTRRVNVVFEFHELPPIFQNLYNLPLGNYLYYLLWQYSAARRAAELHRIRKFDRVQHITWGSLRAPSFMGKLGIPFIFGPVGGGEDTPKLLRRGMGWRGRVWDFLRRISNSLLALDPIMRRTYADASEILTATSETLRKIPASYQRKARVQPAAGINLSVHEIRRAAGSLRRTGANRATLQLLYVGRLLPWKGLHLALRALSALGENHSSVRLTVIGRGYDEQRLKQIAKRLNLEQTVKWLPWMPREQLLRSIPEFDLFLFPSLHDSGGMAVLEALSAGLPVVCLDLGGPSEFVDNTCGQVIVTRGADEDRVAAQIAAFLTELIDNPAKLEGLSDGARQRANHFTWEAHVRNVYGESLALQAD